MNLRLIIPARLLSSRLPNKPLRMIAGVPMIVRTWRQCLRAMPQEAITVATDSAEIAEVCRAVGADVVMTSPDCLTGTDRVAEAAMSRPAEYYLNVQGDEPIFNPDDITSLVAAAVRAPDRILLGYAPITTESDFRSPSVPKVVAAEDGRLIYMSRQAIPSNKGLGFVQAWRQICAYGFPPAALVAYAGRKSKTPLELIEDIEALRFIEMGFPVYVIPMSDISIPVDHPHDIERVERALVERGD